MTRLVPVSRASLPAGRSEASRDLPPACACHGEDVEPIVCHETVVLEHGAAKFGMTEQHLYGQVHALLNSFLAALHEPRALPHQAESMTDCREAFHLGLFPRNCGDDG